MPSRRSLTREALERAIRYKLVRDLGIEASCVVIPVRLVATKGAPGRANWRLDTRGVEASCATSLEDAAEYVARTTDLRDKPDPLAETVRRVDMRTRLQAPRYLDA